jgi:hypothetical protein
MNGRIVAGPQVNAGIHLPKEDATANSIRAAVTSLLANSTVQQRCREWSKKMAEGGGAAEAVALVEELWQGRVVSSQEERQGALIAALLRHGKRLRTEGEALRGK